MEMIVCSKCGEAIPEDEVMLSMKKIPGTDLYWELCTGCYNNEHLDDED